MTVDGKAIDERIERSGLKINYICKELGISRQAFNYKKKGIHAFRTSEIFTLCTLLHIEGDDRKKIFAEEVE